MSAPVLVWVEGDGDVLTKSSREALNCAQGLGSDVRAFKANDACVDCVCALIEKEQPNCLIAPSTPRSRDVLARAAARLGSGLAQDCIEVKMEGTAVVAKRYVQGGRFIADVALSGRVPMATIRPS